MRIGIDCRTWVWSQGAGPAGVSHATQGLVNALVRLPSEHTFVLFAPNAEVAKQLPRADHVEIVILPRRRWPLISTHWSVAQVMRRANLDVLHGPGGTLPLGYHGPSVLTVHDVLILSHPEWFPNSWFWRRVALPVSLRRANRVIASSQATADDVVKYAGIPRERVAVVALGVILPEAGAAELEVARRELGVERPYFLFVGTVEPRKNIARLVVAFQRFSAAHPQVGYGLIVAGSVGWKAEESLAAIRAAGSRVRYVGYVTPVQKRALLAGAVALVWPTLAEGFGLPVLEAMATGTPVITSKTSSLPEVAGDAALLVDPTDVGAITHAISQVVTDEQLRQRLIAKGHVQAATFTWETAAQRTLEVYQASA